MNSQQRLNPPDDVRRFVYDALRAANTSHNSALAVAEALTEASLRGVDSHGIRLLAHYIKGVENGRINPAPQLSFSQGGRATGTVNGDDGFGHHASYFAVDRAIELAKESGVGAVSVINSSHFGAAGCYVLRAAEQGLAAFGSCNSDSFVLPYDGTKPFHGTNPLAFAAPVPGQRPFLMDMATSVVPWNRVLDLRMKKMPLPPDVAVDNHGEPTVDPDSSSALLPLGGIQYGYKGAALASVAEVLSSVMTGMEQCSRLLPMTGPDFSTPRHLGHFFVVIDPLRFVSAELYEAGMLGYLTDLRGQPARLGKRVMAPGDREWAEESERRKRGIPISESLACEFSNLAVRLSVQPPQFG